jgi:ribosomal protein S12 methylthiotransferase accessory factor
VLIDERSSVPMISVGGAASLDASRARLKAMVEAAQTREWAKVLPREQLGTLREDYTQVRTFEDHVALYAHGDMRSAIKFLVDGPTVPPRRSNVAAPISSVSGALTVARESFRAADLDAIVVDLTTPDVAQCGYVVVKVVIPGLQPLDADYRQRFLGGKRLYELPGRMGLANPPTTPAELNPDPHPYP